MSTRLPRWLDLNVLLIVLISKVVLLIFAAEAFLVIGEKPFSVNESFLGIWNRWDATQYLKIAQEGYVAAGDDRFLIVFFPLYPALVALMQSSSAIIFLARLSFQVSHLLPPDWCFEP